MIKPKKELKIKFYLLEKLPMHVGMSLSYYVIINLGRWVTVWPDLAKFRQIADFWVKFGT